MLAPTTALTIALSGLVLAACGPSAKPTETDFPLGGDAPASAEAAPLADGQPIDFASCRMLDRGGGVVDLRCDEGSISESRAPLEGEPGDMLDGVIDSLRGRYGAEIEVASEVATVGGATAHVRRFAGRGEPPVSGMVVSLDNEEQLFWAIACFREAPEIDEAWCRRAIDAIGRAGGATRVGAQPIDPLAFAGDTLVVPEGCQQTAPARIACPGVELSWMSSDGRDPLAVRDETVAKLRSAAEAESVPLEESEPACRLADTATTCHLLQLTDPTNDGALSFLIGLAEVDGTPTLAICSYAGEVEGVPAPCDQVLALE